MGQLEKWIYALKGITEDNTLHITYDEIMNNEIIDDFQNHRFRKIVISPSSYGTGAIQFPSFAQLEAGPDGNNNLKHGRLQLGFLIKDKLIDSGLLRYGEVITEDILDMYGNHFLEFRQVPEKKDHFYITFDPG